MPGKKERDENKEARENGVEINLSFGDFFKGLGNFVNLLGDMERSEKSEITRTGRVKGPGSAKAVYGYSVRFGLGGKPTLERFGNIKEDGDIDETHEPLTDLFDEKEFLNIILEMPGIDEKNIEIDIEEKHLFVKGSGKDRHYEKDMVLPARVEPASLEKMYRNGILEIRLKKI